MATLSTSAILLSVEPLMGRMPTPTRRSGVGGAELGDPVVVDADDFDVEVGVGGVVAPEAKDTGVHDLGADAVQVLVLEAFDGVPCAGSGVFIAEAGHVDFLALGFVGGCSALAGKSDSELSEALHDVEVAGVT